MLDRHLLLSITTLRYLQETQSGSKVDKLLYFLLHFWISLLRNYAILIRILKEFYLKDINLLDDFILNWIFDILFAIDL